MNKAMENGIETLVVSLGLIPHPEGGYYRENYRSSETVPGNALPARFGGERAFSTAIYYLLGPGDFSAFHRIQSDETWHFYTGCALHIHVLDKAGGYRLIRMGSRPEKGEVFQATVLAGEWFASEPADPAGHSFVGCTVAPGFDFRDFELAKAADLSAAYPEHAELIRKRCR
jgi:hypothetical protein